MEDEDLGYYKCKQCPERFRTTFDLQKHKRTNHRNSSSANSQINKSLPPASPTDPNNESEGTESNTGVTGEISSTPSGRHLTCAFCRYKYDTKDPVVVHLLKLSRRENNGSLKCPFCVKVKLQQPASVTSDSESRGTATGSSKGSLRPKRNTRPTWRVSEQGRSKSSGSTASISSSSSAPVTSEGRRALNHNTDTPTSSSRRSLKRGSSSQRLIEKSMRKSLCKSEIPSRTPSTPASSASTPAVLLSSSGFNSASVSPTRKSEKDDSTAAPFFSGSQQRSYELTYSKQNEGKPDPQGSAMSNPDSNYQTPSKVPVLLNSEPVSTGSRLAVPKVKDFDKGNLRCQYCSYVAESFREIQSHINTHLAKSYPCEFCSNIYRSKQYVAKHTATHHPDKIDSDKMATEKSFMSIASTICGTSNKDTSFSTANTDSQSSNSTSNPFASPETSRSNYGLVGSEMPRTEPEFPFHQEHREFFMFAKENKEVEKVVKLENF